MNPLIRASFLLAALGMCTCPIAAATLGGADQTPNQALQVNSALAPLPTVTPTATRIISPIVASTATPYPAWQVEWCNHGGNPDAYGLEWQKDNCGGKQ